MTSDLQRYHDTCRDQCPSSVILDEVQTDSDTKANNHLRVPWADQKLVSYAYESTARPIILVHVSLSIDSSFVVKLSKNQASETMKAVILASRRVDFHYLLRVTDAVGF